MNKTFSPQHLGCQNNCGPRSNCIMDELMQEAEKKVVSGKSTRETQSNTTTKRMDERNGMEGDGEETNGRQERWESFKGENSEGDSNNRKQCGLKKTFFEKVGLRYCVKLGLVCKLVGTSL